MNRFFSKKLTILVRTVLLFGLLNGLLFSVGEGIRLLPFPVSETSQTSNFKYQKAQQDKYEKNFHRFENNSQTYHFKNQKNPDNHSINISSSPKDFVSVSLHIPQNKHFPEQQTLYLSQLFRRNSASRAPPFV